MPETGPPAAASDHPTPARPLLVLAFDFGSRRIGVACGDTVSRAARPLAGIANGASGPRWDLVEALLRDWRPDVLVVGLPYNVDGSENPMSTTVRRFASDLHRRSGLPVSLVDERYSSLDAESRLRNERELGLRRRRVAKTDVDAAAACVILERWYVEPT
jgi:putative Holliday junction resolvase